jgi:hypothetical protein
MLLSNLSNFQNKFKMYVRRTVWSLMLALHRIEVMPIQKKGRRATITYSEENACSSLSTNTHAPTQTNSVFQARHLKHFPLYYSHNVFLEV